MSRMRRMAEWTPLIIVGIMVGLGLLDYVLFRVGGNQATISVALLEARCKNPTVAHLTAYAFAVFLGHVYFPAPDPVPPPVHVVLAWCVVALSPVFAVLIVIGAGDGQSVHEVRSITEPLNQLKFAGVMLCWWIGGLLVGRFILKQHPLAEITS